MASLRTIIILLSPILFTGQICFRENAVLPPVAYAPPIGGTDSLLYQRFTPLASFIRIPAEASSFAAFLRALPLKPPGTAVKLYNGKDKPKRNVYAAVVDLPIGARDLHQCADAVIRLRAEYLWNTRQYDKIHFNLTNGFRVDYSRWRNGERVKVNGNQTSWAQTAAASTNYKDFWRYLEFVFTYAGTLSLAKELVPVQPTDLQPGDVFIRGGSPGHAVIVVDMATDQDGRKIFLLAQSYMPAQDIQILQNPADVALSPWYSTTSTEDLRTPEWDFKWHELKRFKAE